MGDNIQMLISMKTSFFYKKNFNRNCKFNLIKFRRSVGLKIFVHLRGKKNYNGFLLN